MILLRQTHVSKFCYRVYSDETDSFAGYIPQGAGKDRHRIALWLLLRYCAAKLVVEAPSQLVRSLVVLCDTRSTLTSEMDATFVRNHPPSEMSSSLEGLNGV